MTCKDCIHYGVCHICEVSNDDPPYKDGEIHFCNDFKDSSLFVKLPCKLGTQIYMVKQSHFTKEYYIVPEQVVTFLVHFDCINFETTYTAEYGNNIGKTIFFTREEAEQAMERRLTHDGNTVIRRSASGQGRI